MANTGYPLVPSVRLVGQVSAIFEGRDNVGTTAAARKDVARRKMDPAWPIANRA